MTADIVVWNEPGYQHVFHEWTGPVGRHLIKAGRSLEVYAIAHAGFDTGALVSSVDSVFTIVAGVLTVETGANPHQSGVVGYALYNHEGTKPHEIKARNVQYLRFPDRKQGGRIRYAKRVWHPGTSATKYLTKHLREAIR